MDNYPKYLHLIQEDSPQHRRKINLPMLNYYQQKRDHHQHIIFLKLQAVVNVSVMPQQGICL
jgi:hypothetical protein